VYGIKTRLVGSYLVVIFITVFLFELFMLVAIRQYYISNIKESLRNTAEVSAKFYSQYLPASNIKQQKRGLMENFVATTDAQVQVMNIAGNVIADSTGVAWEDTVRTPDVKAALAGKTGEWQGTIIGTDEPVLAISHPLKSGDQIVGVLRLITSLMEVNAVITRTSFLLICAGIAIVCIAVVVSIFLSHTITNPVKEITRGAQQMAAGKFSVRIPKTYDDELGKLTDTLHYMAEEIMRHEQVKNDFIASVSHELRTPLTSIKGWAVTLLSGTMDNRQELQDGLDIIEKETDRLTMLVEELLDFSNIVAGRITMRIDKINIEEWLHRIIKQTTPRAIRQNIELMVEIEENLPEISGDANRLKQVLINLLDNAFKFTPPGGSVRVSAAVKEGNVVISVRDTGEGIPAEDLSGVKKRFYKGNSRHAGSGLGLSICDEIISLHKGQMDIYSTPGAGTQIDVTLPV
jgi:signal transduction histidine kinase